ncbi:DUF1366 domain-containing protein [Streptococcus thoraltensis]|uniref:DUF1366 domain-containing protein n=1 Tax=Streptococcus thoraltensis TaxID=55085 RepID=UPI00035E2D7E|nr:DUF1366 domain-containing protein [Streptococcus thoraltensis]QBX31101.1 hypothetical protein Javan616_0008 [Streptococcus phage Javan616]
MRAWNVVGKYPVYDDSGNITHIEITIASTTGGYATYTERVVGNHMDKAEVDLVELCREAHFKSEYANRAMAESVQKIDEMETIVKAAKEFMAESAEKFKAMQTAQLELVERLSKAETERNDRFKAIEEKFQILNGSMMEMLTEIYANTQESEVTKDENLENTDNVDGSDNSTANSETEKE